MTVQNVVTYDVVVAVDNREARSLKPGMTANETVTAAKRDNGSASPGGAPIQGREGGRPRRAAGRAGRPGAGKKAPSDSTVYVLEDGQPVPVKVKIGIRDAQHAEVTGWAI